MRALRPILKVLLVLVLVVVVVAAAGGFTLSRLAFPKTKGEITLDGDRLDGAVDVYRDDYGIPHIYADSLHDAYFAQGYVHAQDRFWQMDFQRAVGKGRLSEIFGDSQLETDAFLRTLGWARVAEEEWAAASPEARDALTAYAEGVNAYLGERSGVRLSFEYSVLKLTNAGYRPAAWQPTDTLVWAKAMAWDLRSNLDLEIARAILTKEVGAGRVDDLFPPYPSDRPVIVPGFDEGPDDLVEARAVPEAAPLLEVVAARLDLLDDLVGIAGADIGSNNWVIAGSRTDTGMPILANDPHLGIQMPSIWYEIALHCTACDFDVAGFSLVGVPAVIIGHNERIAWGVTNLATDVQDLYIERINPENRNQYEVNGQWVDMDQLTESVLVAGEKPVNVSVRLTRHGPLISDTFEALEDFDETAGIELPEDYAIALRWTALEPSRLVDAVLGINRAGNWGEFREALGKWDVPSQNFVYADVAGNIGYQTPGKIPIRAGGDGRIPVPGWTNDYEWTGYIPFEELPHRFNPPEGYIVTANNAVTDDAYGYFLGRDWSYGARAQRIVDMIEEASGPISLDQVEAMQRDNRNLIAEELLPYLTGFTGATPEIARAQAMLTEWGRGTRAYQQDAGSAGAALFAAVWRQLLAATFDDELSADYQPEGRDRWLIALRPMLSDPADEWWDDTLTPTTERRDEILARALNGAWRELEDELGGDPEEWEWGDLHTATFRNATFGESGIGLIEWMFNRGPFATSGGGDIVNATGWDAREGYEVLAVPSMRMIVDLADFDRSRAVHTTGQSGHAFHRHYIDMADLWVVNATQPLPWERSSVEERAADHLRLVPGS